MWAARAAGQAGAPDVPDAPAPMVTHPNGVTTPYVQPSQEQKLDNYWNEAFGPNPMLATVFVAGWHQWRRVPPEWREGMAGYGERYGSDFASSVINMSTRYALAPSTFSRPTPLVALAWGSRSNSNTRWPRALRQAARLTAVVVFPTPPFWLATAMILAGTG